MSDNHKTSICTLANLKGGTSKTTTTVNLAAAFAHTGKRVLVVDMDPQGSATEILGGREAAKQTGKSLAYAIRNELPLETVVLSSNTLNVDLLAGTSELQQIVKEKTGSFTNDKLLKFVFETKALNQYQVVLADTHPSRDCLLASALNMTHYYLIPVFPEPSSSRGLLEMVELAEEVRKYSNSSLTILGCVITKFDKRNATHRNYEKIIREIAASANFHVFENNIPISNHVQAAESACLPLLDYQPNSTIATSYSMLAGEILPALKGRRVGRIPTPNTKSLAQAAHASAIEIIDEF